MEPLYTRFESSENPLSSDIFLIKGSKYNYVFDCGSSDKALEFLSKIENKAVIISHFHQDHTSNVPKTDFSVLYGSKKTCLYLKTGTVVDSLLKVDDCDLEIIPLTSCHAKGCLMVNLSHKYLFVGDALCPCMLTEKTYGYNVTMLLSTINELKKQQCSYIVVSHSGNVIEKEKVIEKLTEIYIQRKPNNPYISQLYFF